MPRCPACGSEDTIKNGHIHNGKPKFGCKACGRQFVENPSQKRISAQTKQLIDDLLLSRMCLNSGCNIMSTPSMRACRERSRRLWPKKRHLTIQADELWSFVGSKADQTWLWWAIDADTRLVMGCAVGPRDKATAQQLWDSLPPVYRQQAVCYTDFLEIYASVLPTKRHKAVDKASGKTSLIERLNNTIRQRCSRLVRKTLSFSKKRANHIGAIWYFIHADNARILARLNRATTC